MRRSRMTDVMLLRTTTTTTTTTKSTTSTTSTSWVIPIKQNLLVFEWVIRGLYDTYNRVLREHSNARIIGKKHSY